MNKTSIEARAFLPSFLHHKLSPRFRHFLFNLSLSIFFGLAWFLLLYGNSSLDTSNVNWIYQAGGDIFQHQIGWEWFRQAPWQFPLGRISAYGYPFGTFVSYMDSIPLLAIPFKLLSPLLTPNFQYMGIWELISYICQMLIGILILDEFTPSTLKKLLGASLLVLSPPLIFRSFSHDSLTAQWILLAGIWFILVEYRHKLWRGAWVLLISIALLVHVYFVAMLLPLWVISLFFRYSRNKNKGMVVVDVAVVAAAIFLIGYSTGLFSLLPDDLIGKEFGLYSWNLNGFFNPFSNSSILNPLPTGTSGQYEGFSYLGLGNLVLLPIGLIIFFTRDTSRHNLYFFLPFVIVSFIFILFALSNEVFFNAALLWNIQLPEFLRKIFSIFSSSGRFIWPVFYFIVLFGIISIVRNNRFAAIFLVLALLVQFIDLQPLFSVKKSINFETYTPSLQSEFWPAAAKSNQHILLIPAEDAFDIYAPIALFARQSELTLNWGYFSRSDSGAIANYAIQAWQDLLANQSDPQTLYIFWGDEWVAKAKQALSSKMLVCQVDGYEVVFSSKNPLVQADIDLARYCTFP